MAQTELSRYLGLMLEAEDALTDRFQSLLFDIAARLTLADPERTREAVGEQVVNFFIGRKTNGQPDPFEVNRDGSARPLAPYPAFLFEYVGKATRLGIEKHRRIMLRGLQSAPDVRDVLTLATRNPLARARQVQQQVTTDDLFRPRALARYDPAHRWVDPNGYRLSDRIWRASTETRRKIDFVVAQGIQEGKSAVEIANDLEAFLLPERTRVITRTPYGSKGSFDARRLARTEITRAHAQADEASAALNPFVTEMSVNLSASHPQTDICDEAAAASPFPKDAIPAQYQIPLHPHCLCYYTYQQAPVQETIDALREDVQSQRRQLVDLIGPLLVLEFERLLLSGIVGETHLFALP